MKKPKRPPVKGLEVPIYLGTVHFIAAPEKWKAMAEWLGEPDEVDLKTTLGRTSIGTHPQTGMAAACIGVFDKSLATLAHECAHLAFMTFDRCSIDPRNDEGEAFCYFLGWLMREGERALFKKGKQ